MSRPVATKQGPAAGDRLRGIARDRLDKRLASPELESEEIKRLRAEGYVVLGGHRDGYIILPPEYD